MVLNIESVEIIDVNKSPEMKRLLNMQKDIAQVLECRKTERAQIWEENTRYDIPMRPENSVASVGSVAVIIAMCNLRR